MKKIYETDPWLEPFRGLMDERSHRFLEEAGRLVPGGAFSEGINNHLYYGIHRMEDGGWVFREWAPNAVRIYLIGDFNNWKRVDAYALKPVGGGSWEISLPSFFLHHGNKE